VDNRAEVREFLTTRRAKITPERAGVPLFGGTRRVPGLRREEVALLAGVSIDYYVRLEKGNLTGVSEQVLEAVARALQLDEAEHAHLHDLARAANTAPARAARRRAAAVRPSVTRLLDSMVSAPAFIRNARLDVLAINRLGRALYAPVVENRDLPVNLARFTFLDGRAPDFYPDWHDNANNTVALLRTEAGRDPYDRALSDLVGELATRSDEFRVRWAAHDVHLHRTGRKHFNHPVVGALDLAFDSMELPGDPGLTLIACSAEPGTPSEDGLRLLASWAATLDDENGTPTPHQPGREHTGRRGPGAP
jgi:transcriptional regulator with XRE-family HTH domain